MIISSQSLSIFLQQKSFQEQETSIIPLKLILLQNQYSQQMNRVISNKLYFGSEIAAYTRRGKHRPLLNIPIGTNIDGFQLKQAQYYRDFDLTHLKFKNGSNNATIHQLECAEQNNTLSIVFKTKGLIKPAMNYALQKLLQCGSKKYPVRNLLMEMNKRSFSLLNPAQTTDNYLMFSFNSPILKDFSNLFEVYSSMLFDPLFREEDFYQVVRRLTFDNKHLGFTGDLAEEIYQNQFNTDQTIYKLISEELLRVKTETVCKPLDLMQISFADVSKYYKETITLPNCTFILHGDLNIHYFIEQCNKNIEKFKPSSHLPIFVQNSNLEFKQIKKTVNFQHLGQQTILILSYKINASEEELLLLEILSYLLFDMPQSPFMAFNTPDTPYPNLYGFHQRYLNIAITFYQPNYEQERHMQTVQTFKLRERIFLQKQKQIISLLDTIVQKGFDTKMVQKCLLHLENNYYERRGLRVIESVASKLLEGKSLANSFSVTALITRLLKDYRKDRVFENLVKKYLVNNEDFIILRGRNNMQLIEQENHMNRSLLAQMQLSLPSSQLNQIAAYSPPNYLQDYSLLPEINPSELQCFEDLNGEEIIIKNIKTMFSPRHFGNKLTFKFDLTDIGEEDIPLLTLFCKAFPQMGYKNVTDKAYRALLETYVGKIDMSYQTVRSKNGHLKVQIYLTIQFTDRNYQYAFSILSGLLHDFNYSNITALSRVLQDSASNCFNELSQDLLHYHGVHLASSKSPFAFFESPIFQARTLCSMAADIKKVTNPKHYLQALGHKFEQIWGKMVGYSRMELLWECNPQKKSFYYKYIDIMFSQIKNQGILPQTIDVSTFPKQKWLKYFPNYQNQLVFQAFSVPYRQNLSPQTLVLSSVINNNISTFNKIGGCFLHKGALISFIAGSRTKFLQFQDHYKKIDHLNVAKRKIFQHFDRYTVENQFKSGISMTDARFFKEAVLAVQKQKVEQVLNQFILKPIKEGNSSMLSLGPRLQNYEPLIKKGWQIQRSIEDLSLGMQSLSRKEIEFRAERYADIS